MEHIRESIEIYRSPGEVFAFLRQIEPRLRLSPGYEVLNFTKLTPGPIQKGSHYRVRIKREDEVIEYEGMVTDFIENELIETQDISGRLRVRIILSKTERGTLLTHDEEFSVRGDVIYQEEDDSHLPFWKRVLRRLIELESVRIDEHQRRIEEIKSALRKNLKEWLKRIKAELESAT
ncbi:MAG: hypothetical protein ACK4TF_04180 [Thermodesulfovibrionales bacterium]